MRKNPVCFVRFGSKERLFEEAVVIPFKALMERFTEETIDYHTSTSHAGAQGVRQYASELWTLVENNRSLFRAMIISLQSNKGLKKQFHEPNAPIIQHMDRVAASGSRLLHKAKLSSKDVAINARFTFGLVLSLVIFGDIFFACGKSPSRDRLIQKITAYTPYGKMKPSRPTTHAKRVA